MKENILNFDKVLIANRGEVALRIIRTLKEMDIKSVAVYSEADRFCAHVQAADEALCIGPQNPKESYLNIEAIITAAKISKAQAIHPGYGFLAENVAFAKAVEDAGLVFIGPNSQTILELGQKAHAKLMAKNFSRRLDAKYAHFPLPAFIRRGLRRNPSTHQRRQPQRIGA